MRTRTYDLTSLPEAVAALGQEWSRHALRARPSDFRLRLRVGNLGGDVSLSTLSYGAETVVEPGARDDVLLLKMPLRGAARIVGNDAEVVCDPGRFAVVDVRRVRRVTASADFEAVVLRIRRGRLLRHLEAALGTRLRADLSLAPVLEEGSPGWATWAPVAAMLRELAMGAGDASPPRLLAAMEETAVSALLHAWPGSHAEALGRPAEPPVPRHVRRAMEYARTHAAAAPTTRDLAGHAGVSVRTLFDGFAAFRGQTPAEYVRGLRLEGVREELLGGARTSQAARRWGFRHLGHFAALYRARYGEAPSQTGGGA